MAWDDKNYFWKKESPTIIFLAMLFSLSGFIVGCLLTYFVMR